MELWQWHCRNRRQKKLFQLVYGNAIAEIGGEKWEWICGNGIAEIGGEKKLLQLVCGNGIDEIEEKKKCGHWFVAMELLPKQEEKKWFVTMALSK